MITCLLPLHIETFCLFVYWHVNSNQLSFSLEKQSRTFFLRLYITTLSAEKIIGTFRERQEVVIIGYRERACVLKCKHADREEEGMGIIIIIGITMSMMIINGYLKGKRTIIFQMRRAQTCTTSFLTGREVEEFGINVFGLWHGLLRRRQLRNTQGEKTFPKWPNSNFPP